MNKSRLVPAFFICRGAGLKSFKFKEKSLPLDHAHVMGILNVTPDSFSDGGQFAGVEQAMTHARQMVAAGAAIVDVGGESTRPGAAPVSLQQEMDRVLPVVESLTKNVDTIISVDTSSPEVMTEAAALGAHLINDVRALQRSGAMAAAAMTGLPVCLMHKQGEPDSMQDDPVYADVMTDVHDFFVERIAACHRAGIEQHQIILDPGFGFGKLLNHNLTLLNRLDQLTIGGCPLLVGMSRKRMIGEVLNKAVNDRLNGSLALAAAAVMNGAWIVRVHDVAETVDVVRMLNAVKQENLA
ncbi:dihydropteroate synthase [Reinekea marinisedimentorum]|uniref:Dihydropteroate synthase n=1 Tax=Reinekea marinisedimentorum TaxID=230495 RepID=A0A4V2UJ08_9GAMM|nr:dihydropteroate synthase [Reinekea marinisedimentorum]